MTCLMMMKNRMKGDTMKEEGMLTSFPANAFLLSETETELHVMLKDEDEMPRRIRMVVNSGKPHGHHMWGNMVLDMSRGKVGKQKKSILCEHNPLLIAGCTDRMAIGEDGKMVAEGYLTDKTDIGRERMALLSEGHPFEVSCYVVPKRVVRLSEGQTREVNGRQVEGPLHVFQDWKVREVSLCALGADERTSAVALSDTGKGEVEVHLVGAEGSEEKGITMTDEEKKALLKAQEDEAKDEDTDTNEEDSGEGEDEAKASEDGEGSEDTDTNEGDEEDSGSEDEEDAELSASEVHPADVERARCSAIHAKAIALGLGELGQTLIDDGSTIEAAIIKLQDARLKQLTDSAPDAPGVNEDEGTSVDQSLPLEERAQAEWSLADAKKRKAFFNDFKVYLAYLKHKQETD